MAKTKWAIDMDFAKARCQADELDRIAREIERVANSDLQDCLTNVKNNWSGINAKAYIEKGNIVKENINNVAKNLRNTANTIRDIARRTYYTELRALELAKKREV